MAPSWIRIAKDLPKRLVVEAEKMLDQQQMSGRGDREKLGQALNHAEDERLENIEEHQGSSVEH